MRIRKNVYVKSYVNKNLGDDLMLSTFAEYFHNDYNIYFNCPDKYTTFYKNILNYENCFLTHITLREIHKFGLGFFSCVVSLGGSTLMGRRYAGCWYRLLNYIYLKIMSLFGTKFAIVGCNVGPFINAITETFVKLELASAQMITCRDLTSYEFINNSVGKRRAVYRYSDILADISQRYGVISNSSDIIPFGIAVHYTAPDNVCAKIAEFANHNPDIRRRGFCLICFCTADSQGDVTTAEKIKSMINEEITVNIFLHNDNNKYILEQMAKCEKIIAIRFHSAIFAMSLGIQVLPIAYSNKLIDYMRSINYSGNVHTFESFARCSCDDISEYFDKEYTFDKPGDSCSHFQKLEEFVAGN